MTAENMTTRQRAKHRVLLVDNHPMVRRGIADVLNREEDLKSAARRPTSPKPCANWNGRSPTWCWSISR